MPNEITEAKNILGLTPDELKLFGYMEKPIDEFYLRKNIRLSHAYNGNMDYDQSPYSAIFMTTPDCTNIMVPGEDAVFDGLRDDLSDSEKGSNQIGNARTIDDDLYSIPVGIRRQLVQLNQSPFIPLISNFYDDTSIDVPDIYLDTVDVGENRFGVRQTLPRNVIQSQVGQNINISYSDVSMYDEVGGNLYGKLLLTNLHKAWVRYINAVKLGILFPGDKYSFNLKTYHSFINEITKVQEPIYDGFFTPILPSNDDSATSRRAFRLAKMVRVINFVSSLYYFKLAPDGKTITYWAKFSGLYPKTYGGSGHSAGNKEISRITVEYQTQFFEDLKISLLESFNITSLHQIKNIKSSSFYQEKGANGFIINAERTNLPSTFSNGTPYVYKEGGSYKLEVSTNAPSKPYIAG